MPAFAATEKQICRYRGSPYLPVAGGGSGGGSYPTVKNRTSGGSGGSNVTSQAITLPTYSAGDLLLVQVTSDGQPLLTESGTSNWTSIISGSTTAGDGLMAVFGRIATGTSADNLTIASSASEAIKYYAWSISNHSLTNLSNIATIASTTGTSQSSNSFKAQPPTVGSMVATISYLAILMHVGESSTAANTSCWMTTVPASPSGWTTLQLSSNGTSTDTNAANTELNIALGTTSLTPGLAGTSTSTSTRTYYEVLLAIPGK